MRSQMFILAIFACLAVAWAGEGQDKAAETSGYYKGGPGHDEYHPAPEYYHKGYDEYKPHDDDYHKGPPYYYKGGHGYRAHKYTSGPCKDGAWTEVAVTSANASQVVGAITGARAWCTVGTPASGSLSTVNPNPAATYKIGGTCTITCVGPDIDVGYDRFQLMNQGLILGSEVQQTAASTGVGKVQCDGVWTTSSTYAGTGCTVTARAFCCVPTHSKADYNDNQYDD